MAESWKECFMTAADENAVALEQAYTTFNALVPTDKATFDTWLENEYDA
jgi:hypothetical protein